MSVWRNVKEGGRNARGHAPSTGADETAVRVKCKKTIVGAVTDAATERTLGMDAPVERDSDGFAGWLPYCVSGFGGETMVADDLSAYKPVVNRMGVDHRICAARVKKSAWNRLDKTDGWEWVKARIWRLLTELPLRQHRPLVGRCGDSRSIHLGEQPSSEHM